MTRVTKTILVAMLLILSSVSIVSTISNANAFGAAATPQKRECGDGGWYQYTPESGGNANSENGCDWGTVCGDTVGDSVSGYGNWDETHLVEGDGSFPNCKMTVMCCRY